MDQWPLLIITAGTGKTLHKMESFFEIPATLSAGGIVEEGKLVLEALSASNIVPSRRLFSGGVCARAAGSHFICFQSDTTLI